VIGNTFCWWNFLLAWVGGLFFFFLYRVLDVPLGGRRVGA
jgi:hypothetical protein